MISDLLDQLARDIPPLRGAACRGKEHIMDVPTARDRQAVARAQAVCANCPALTACADWLAGVPKHRLPTGVVAGRFVKPPWLRPLPPPKPKPETKTDKATRWLTDYLSDGPVISTQLRADAAAAGIERHNLARARRRLGVQLERLTGVHGGQRWWTLPRNPNRKATPMTATPNLFNYEYEPPADALLFTADDGETHLTYYLTHSGDDLVGITVIDPEAGACCMILTPVQALMLGTHLQMMTNRISELREDRMNRLNQENPNE